MTQKQCRQNIFSSLFFIAVMFMIFVAIPSEITLNTLWGGSNTGVNSRTFPYFACTIMLVAALFQLITATVRYIRLLLKEGKTQGEKIDWLGEFRALLIFACCVLYAVLFDKIGYIPATLIVPPLVLGVLQDRNWRHYLSVYAVGALMYVVFQYLLKITLP